MNIFIQLLKSLYSPKTIALTRFQKIGKTILYAFFLSFLAAFPNFLFISSSFVSAFSGLDEIIEEKIPSFSIQNGKLVTEAQSVVEVKKGEYDVLFDPVGAVERDNLKWRQNAIGILPDKFVIVSNGNIQQLEYDDWMDADFSKKDVTGWIHQISELTPIIVPVLLIVLFIMSAAAKFMEITLLAVIGLLFKQMMKKRLNFQQLWNISAYSVTLSTVFFAIMNVLQINVSFAVLINWFVHTTVLYMALKEIPKPKTPIKSIQKAKPL